eukprot:c9129_g1_i3.p1 GENE.c9129_g1_i3~~c9129_g1_i3.p1  ORF type:complete len:349 (+),score=66.98 c9129_g1_i3:116-1048(+)
MKESNPDIQAREAWSTESSRLKSAISAQLSGPLPDADQLPEWVDEVKQLISKLEHLVVQYSHVIPKYDSESSTQDVQKFKQALETVQNQVAPKKKFAFKTKVTKTTKTASADDSLVVPASTPLTPESFPGVFDVSDEVLVRQAAQDEQEKIRLANVEHVIVRCSKSLVAICHPMGALRIQSIRDCVIAVGPVAGAIYVMDCVNCQLMLSSHQVRIHDCIDCEFYLSAGSKPIIEHCTGLKFAPFRFQYPGLADHQKLVNHAPLENSWQEIQDFRWLRTTQSPNWSLLEESEWKTVVVNDSAEVSIQDSPQ